MKQKFLQLAALGALATGMIFAQTAANPTQAPAGKARVMRRAMVRGRMLKALNLTDAQKTQAKAIFQQAKQSTQPVRQQLKQNRQALAEAVKANNTPLIQQLAVTQGQLEGQMVAARSEAMAKFYQTLTPEQRAQAAQMRTNMKQRLEKFKNKKING